jgi:hypothetical protein
MDRLGGCGGAGGTATGRILNESRSARIALGGSALALAVRRFGFLCIRTRIWAWATQKYCFFTKPWVGPWPPLASATECTVTFLVVIFKAHIAVLACF